MNITCSNINLLVASVATFEEAQQLVDYCNDWQPGNGLMRIQGNGEHGFQVYQQIRAFYYYL